MQYRHTRRGFTLIELLVVVLIISILAAVALPQYQLAVVKSHVGAIKPILVNLKKAQELYYTANGAHTPYYEKLDIDFPCKKLPGHLLHCGGPFVIDPYEGLIKSIRVAYCPHHTNAWDNGCAQNYDFMYLLSLDKDTYGQITCTARTVWGEKICQKNFI